MIQQLMLINIHSYQFLIPRRYSAGHVLTEAEAEALDTYRARTIRDRALRWVQDYEARADGGLLGPEALAELQVKITEYADSHRFIPRPNGAESILERELALVAQDGGSPEEIQAEARRRLAIKAAALTPEDIGL